MKLVNCDIKEYPVYGTGFQDNLGYIATPGESSFKHRFGGNTWNLHDPQALLNGPRLLFCLDLRDPIFREMPELSVEELPFCSYVDGDFDYSFQYYKIIDSKNLIWIEHGKLNSPQEYTDIIPPIHETPLKLERMFQADIPTSEEAYWEISDQFVGGNRFLRVWGAPLWLQNVQDITCNCGKSMRYICSLGYESKQPYSKLLGLKPVFFGEMAFYWFLCQHCLIIAVTSQST